MMSFAVGDTVTWHHERGGYHWVFHTPSRVVAVTKTRVRIAAALERGGEVAATVTPAKLTPKGGRCRVCFGARMEEVMEKNEGLAWTEHVKKCLDCGREFKVSREALKSNDLRDVVFCVECVTGTAVPGERP